MWPKLGGAGLVPVTAPALPLSSFSSSTIEGKGEEKARSRVLVSSPWSTAKESLSVGRSMLDGGCNATDLVCEKVG